MIHTHGLNEIIHEKKVSYYYAIALFSLTSTVNIIAVTDHEHECFANSSTYH